MSIILQKENKVLREPAREVHNIKSAKVQLLIREMADAMFKEPDGVGIAAPQIGESLKLFLVAKDALALHAADGAHKTQKERKKEYLVFINPVLKNSSRKKINDIEGCLSARWIYGEVARHEKVTVEYFDEHGECHHRGASGLMARIIQHEIDHLNGVLFIDRAKNLKTISNL